MRLGVAGLLGLLLVIGMSGVRTAQAAPDLVSLQRDYMRTRDGRALLAALEPHAASAPAGLLDLARFASGRNSALEGDEGTGPIADLARVVGALRLDDLAAARKVIAKVDVTQAEALSWAEALMRLRVGDDDAAVSRLLAPPLFRWDRDAFLLALLGGALVTEDRRMLAAGAMGALERAASRSRRSAVESLVFAVAALDVAEGQRALAFGARVIRRTGDTEGAQALLQKAASLGIPVSDSHVALEGALTAWSSGRAGEVAGLLGRMAPPAGARSAALALRHARKQPRTLALPPRGGHVRGEPKHAVLLAQLAAALGTPTTVSDVRAWMKEQDTQAWFAASARSFLSSRGFAVRSAVGRAEMGDAVLAAGYPFLLFRILRTQYGYREVPTLVRGFDRNTGLWLLEEPDGFRVDVTPRADIAKARIVCAVPRERAALLEPFRGTPAVTQAVRIETALDALDHALQRARAEKDAGKPPTLGPVGQALDRLPRIDARAVVEQVYRAYGLHQAASITHKHSWLVASQETVERSRREPPLLGLEAYVRGQALGVARETAASVAVFDNVVRLEGPSATVEMARFAALDIADDQVGALAAATDAQHLAPLDMSILFYRASLRMRGGDVEGARSDLQRARERKPDDPTLAEALVRLEVMDKRPEVALEILREIERRNPELKEREALGLERRAAEFALIEKARTVEELAWARRSGEPETRRRLAFRLVQLDSDAEAAEGLLRLLLADPDPGVRVTTLRAYLRGWLRDRIETDSILSRRIQMLLDKDPDPAVRRAAASLMGRVSCKIACRGLAARLAGDEKDADPEVRAEIARALEPHDKGKPARTALVAALEDEDTGVRQAAIDVLFHAAATTRGFEADAEPEARAEAVAKWKAWLEE